MRVQVAHIWQDLIGGYGEYSPSSGYWRYLHDSIAREKGLFELSKYGNAQEKWSEFFLSCSVEDALDMIEHSFRFMEELNRGGESWTGVSAKAAIEELNVRIREHSVGYQYAGGQLIRIDSQYVHSEAVLPALALLSTAPFANQFAAVRPSDHLQAAWAAPRPVG